jgi:hypothetical protein
MSPSFLICEKGTLTPPCLVSKNTQATCIQHLRVPNKDHAVVWTGLGPTILELTA